MPQIPTRARSGFTGWHMTAILTAFFGVVFVVNFTMAHLAIATFTGEVVDNGYVASQHFNQWLDEAARERALGWSASVTHGTDGTVAVVLTGAGSQTATLSAIAWRRLDTGDVRRQAITFAAGGAGHFRSRSRLDAGGWRLRLTAIAGNRQWHAMASL